MNTSPIANALTSSMNKSSGSSNASGGSNASSGGYALTPQNFIQLMVTQLQNQDPMSPASNSELLSQMSNIGSLESSTDLQTTMKSVTLQTQIGSASALIGKSVTGINSANQSVTGTVDSVSVAGSDVNLKLDTGDTVSVANLSAIAPPTSAAAAPAGH